MLLADTTSLLNETGIGEPNIQSLLHSSSFASSVAAPKPKRINTPKNRSTPIKTRAGTKKCVTPVKHDSVARSLVKKSTIKRRLPIYKACASKSVLLQAPYCEIPSGSDDSELCGSDDEDEMKKTTQVKQPPVRKRIISLDSAQTKKNKRPGYSWSESHLLKDPDETIFTGSPQFPFDDASPRWFDNKTVHFLSTFFGSEPVQDITRWDRKQEQYCSIPCPNIVKVYNKHMGGVDLMDSLIGLYRCRIRSKKWYHRL